MGPPRSLSTWLKRLMVSSTWVGQIETLQDWCCSTLGSPIGPWPSFFLSIWLSSSPRKAFLSSRLLGSAASPTCHPAASSVPTYNKKSMRILKSLHRPWLSPTPWQRPPASPSPWGSSPRTCPSIWSECSQLVVLRGFTWGRLSPVMPTTFLKWSTLD